LGDWKQEFCNFCDLGGLECLYACCFPCCYALTASQSAGDENQLWGWITCVTGCLTCALGAPCYLPFFVVRQNARKQHKIKV
jgi:hypothetical protein